MSSAPTVFLNLQWQGQALSLPKAVPSGEMGVLIIGPPYLPLVLKNLGLSLDSQKAYPTYLTCAKEKAGSACRNEEWIVPGRKTS